jgi:hypothetical protein
LFDLREDPYERHNRIGDTDHENVARKMHGRLRDALLEYGDDYALDSAFGHDALNVPDSPFE